METGLNISNTTIKQLFRNHIIGKRQEVGSCLREIEVHNIQKQVKSYWSN